MGRTYEVIQGKQMTTTVKSYYMGGGGIYDIQIRLGSRRGKEFYPEEGLDWTLEGVAVLQRGINTFEILCPVPLKTPTGVYDAQCLIRIPDLPYPDNKEIITFKDNAVKVTEREYHVIYHSYPIAYI